RIGAPAKGRLRLQVRDEICCHIWWNGEDDCILFVKINSLFREFEPRDTPIAKAQRGQLILKCNRDPMRPQIGDRRLNKYTSQSIAREQWPGRLATEAKRFADKRAGQFC